MPPPRGRGTAPTGGDFVYENDPSRMGKYELKKGELEYLDASDFLGDDDFYKWRMAMLNSPVSSIKEVHKSDLIGYRTFMAAEALDKAVDQALRDYMDALRKARSTRAVPLCALDESAGERQPGAQVPGGVLAVRDLLEQRTDGRPSRPLAASSPSRVGLAT